MNIDISIDYEYIDIMNIDSIDYEYRHQYRL